MLNRVREIVRESGYQEPLVVIEQDEVLRSLNHTIAYRVFLGWTIAQGLVGSAMVLLFDEMLILGSSLVAFAAIAVFVWQIWITQKGLIYAAKDHVLLHPRARLMAKRVAVFQGLFFGIWMGIASALWIFTDDGPIVHVLFGIATGTMSGLMMWYVNGRMKRSRNEEYG